jgi:hypothetical protein
MSTPSPPAGRARRDRQLDGADAPGALESGVATETERASHASCSRASTRLDDRLGDPSGDTGMPRNFEQGMYFMLGLLLAFYLLLPLIGVKV